MSRKEVNRIKKDQEIKAATAKYYSEIHNPNTEQGRLSDEQVSPKMLQYRKAMASDAIVKVDHDSIRVDENIRRKIDYDSPEFLQLVSSIKRHGVLQSIVVEYREIDNENYELVCVAGHRRLAALKVLSSKEKIPIKLVEFKREGGSTSIALSENVNRKDLHFIEVAETYLYLSENEGLDLSDIAERYHQGSRTVSRYLKMAKWNDEIKSLILENPDCFSLKYVWDNFVLRERTDGQILNLLKRKLVKGQDTTQEKTSGKQVTREKRLKKLSSYYKSNKMNKKTQEAIEGALKYLNLL